MIKIPTPCHIIDLDMLRQNLERISQLKKMAECDILLAIKGFSAPYLFDIMKEVLDGISASGLYEARLGYEFFNKQVQTYSPAFKDEQFHEVLKYSNTVVFNSVAQLQKYGNAVKEKERFCGIRINPQFSEIKKSDANPCGRNSHLGIPISRLPREILDSVDGIHIHAMCEQGAKSLEKLVEYLVSVLGDDLSKLKWINLGGGQLIGRQDYDADRAAKCLKALKDRYGLNVILEPCEGILTRCGYFATKVLDIIENDGQVAILDASPVCHMQDAVFRGWMREILGEVDQGFSYRLCGQTCFAGDTFGWYTFQTPLQIGDIVYFMDTATYTWVKNNAFNGLQFPSICTYSRNEGIKIVKEFGYNDFLRIL